MDMYRRSEYFQPNVSILRRRPDRSNEQPGYQSKSHIRTVKRTSIVSICTGVTCISLQILSSVLANKHENNEKASLNSAQNDYAGIWTGALLVIVGVFSYFSAASKKSDLKVTLTIGLNIIMIILSVVMLGCKIAAVEKLDRLDRCRNPDRINRTSYYTYQSYWIKCDSEILRIAQILNGLLIPLAVMSFLLSCTNCWVGCLTKDKRKEPAQVQVSYIPENRRIFPARSRSDSQLGCNLNVGLHKSGNLILTPALTLFPHPVTQRTNSSRVPPQYRSGLSPPGIAPPPYDEVVQHSSQNGT